MNKAWRHWRLAIRGTAIGGLAAALVACTSPDPALYTIAPVPGAVGAGGPKVIVLQEVVTPRYLERSQVVRSSENFRLDVLANDWWGEPLSSMLARILIQELSQRLPQSVVIGETGAVTASPDATLEVNVLRLDEDASGSLVLQAQASVTFKGRSEPVLRSFRFVVAPPATGTPGEVAAISTAVGQLADGLGSMVLGR